MRPSGRVGTPMAGPCGASVTDCSGWPASVSDGGCCSIPTMVRPPLRRLQRSRRLTLSVPQPALQQSAARKCCPGGRERPRRQAPARSVLDDTSTALRSMSQDNARHVECLTAGRKSTLACPSGAPQLFPYVFQFLPGAFLVQERAKAEQAKQAQEKRVKEQRDEERKAEAKREAEAKGPSANDRIEGLSGSDRASG